MKSIKTLSIALLSLFLLGGCELNELDNYEGPNASINGGIYDQETGELIQQDIINGMQIEYTEHGYDNPQIQYVVVKNDGTYRNNLMFAGTYTIRPVRGNFVPVESEEIVVKGNTVKNFEVQPYIRVRNVQIEKQGNKVVATFNLDQTVTNKVSRIGLFAHQEPTVGAPLNAVASVVNFNQVSNDVTQYRLEINLEANSGNLKPGNKYYFRVGALIDAPEAKYNYAPPVLLEI
ncbi:DUF3823 domain-containing protein [Pontibacter flavimaris]|uniref:DUF3823 domain-containing protein n=1 Tax=Pontibacter flavimaris TaxID=1797110 RepID=A0A1Q5PIK5_9BACT|nr:DUF3823 domain-containing protein [Pontibacter flavimaris]OKL42055.1 hypothetical protein A3841_08630 [Pontibacter flavimaris]